MFGNQVPTIASAAIMGVLPLLGGFVGGAFGDWLALFLPS